MSEHNLASSTLDGKAIVAVALEHTRRGRPVLPSRSVAESLPCRWLLKVGDALEGGGA